MKVDFSQYSFNPNVADELSRRIYNCLAVQDEKNNGINYNDIAATLGAIMASLMLDIPSIHRGEAYQKFCDVLRIEAQIPLVQRNGDDLPPIIAGTLN